MIKGGVGDIGGVSLSGFDPAGVKEEWIAPKKYADPNTSGLKATIKPGMELLDRNLKSR